MPNLPSVLPGSSHTPASMSLGRLNISRKTSIFSQADNKNKAVTSISDLSQKKQTPSSSIFDDHKENKTSIFSRQTNSTTSINRPEKEASTIETDDLRYNYVRRLIKARQAKEQKEAAQKGLTITKDGKTMATTPANEKFKMHLGTGASFHRGLRGGLDKTLKRMVKRNRQTMKNISAADRKILGDIISKHAANRTTGVGYGWSDKKRMKNEVQQLYESHHISKADMQDFKTIIEQLK